MEGEVVCARQHHQAPFPPALLRRAVAFLSPARRVPDLRPELAVGCAAWPLVTADGVVPAENPGPVRGAFK